MKILSSAERLSRKAPADWFTGDAWMDVAFDGAAPSRLQAVYVTYAPAARTAWHTHPIGQVLHVISGLGWIQLEGEAARAIRPGDVVVIGPNENHWHGAEADHTMVHLAMQESDSTGKNVYWGAHVTDEQFGAAH